LDIEQNSFFGLVSNKLPLLSSISAYDNILLVAYSNPAHTKDIDQLIKYSFEQAGIEKSLYYAATLLDERSRFFTMLLRACFASGTVLIDRPSNLLEHEDNSKFFDKAMVLVEDRCKEILVFDTNSNMNWYNRNHD
jgi:ABC-type lipoprotein export system ATPase subunit